MPAAVADRVVEWRPDRPVRRLEIGATFDECHRDVDVVAARRPMKWRLAVLVVVAPGIRIRTGLNEQRDDSGPIREVPGPVTDNVEWSAASGDPKPRSGKRGFCRDQRCQDCDVTASNRCDGSQRIAVLDHDTQRISASNLDISPP